MSSLPFKFPVLLIPEPEDGACLTVLCDNTNFTVISDNEVRSRGYVGQLVFDCLGRSWRLDDLVDLGLVGRSFVGRFFGRVFLNTDIRYELSDELGLPFSEIKERVLAVIAANGEAYSRGEYAIEVYDASKSNEELLEEFVSQVRDCERPLELIAAIDYHDYV